jgi:formamidopyrimidine-DNA glycosylase
LDAVLRGHRLEGYEPIGFAGLKTVAPAPDALVGSVLERVSRRGKYLVLDFGGPRILMHLSQSGRVDVETPAKHTRGKGGVVRLLFAGNETEGPIGVFVREFGKERKAAWWVLAGDDQGPLAGLGPEPDSEEFEQLIRTGDDSRRVHTILRDQHTIAGIGRGYSDDVLWRARLSPYASLASLDPDERTRLVEAVRGALTDGLTKERARQGGLSDPKLGTHFEIHGRAGTPCPRCGEGLRRVSYESYEVAYCPACQTAGKVLADRRMSRLVK